MKELVRKGIVGLGSSCVVGFSIGLGHIPLIIIGTAMMTNILIL